MTDRIPTQTSHLAQLRKAPFERHPSTGKPLGDPQTVADIRTALATTEHFLFTAQEQHA